jgi:sterol-4alpha-carboxylate 3-dehydrogenase (decarboxylating)
MAAKNESYLVIGGCGFVGRHIVEALLARGERAVAVFDLVQRHFDTNVQFFTGDLCEVEDLNKAIKGVSRLLFFSPNPPTRLKTFLANVLSF